MGLGAAKLVGYPVARSCFDPVTWSPRWWYTEGFRRTRLWRVFSFTGIRLRSVIDARQCA